MNRKFPSQVRLTYEEVSRVNRVRVAQYLGISPAEVDAMPEEDYQDVVNVMWSEIQK
jgi:hypothetical protein